MSVHAPACADNHKWMTPEYRRAVPRAIQLSIQFTASTYTHIVYVLRDGKLAQHQTPQQLARQLGVDAADVWTHLHTTPTSAEANGMSHNTLMLFQDATHDDRWRPLWYSWEAHA